MIEGIVVGVVAVPHGPHEPGDLLVVLGVARRDIGASRVPHIGEVGGRCHALMLDRLDGADGRKARRQGREVGGNIVGKRGVADARGLVAGRMQPVVVAIDGRAGKWARGEAGAAQFDGDVEEPVPGAPGGEEAPDDVAHPLLLVAQIESRSGLADGERAQIAGGRHEAIVENAGLGAIEVAKRPGAAGKQQGKGRGGDSAGQTATSEEVSHACASGGRGWNRHAVRVCRRAGSARR